MINEIVYIYLEHLSDYNETSIIKVHLSDELYKALEIESNIFGNIYMDIKKTKRLIGSLKFHQCTDRYIDDKYCIICGLPASNECSSFGRYAENLCKKL